MLVLTNPNKENNNHRIKMRINNELKLPFLCCLYPAPFQGVELLFAQMQEQLGHPKSIKYLKLTKM